MRIVFMGTPEFAVPSLEAIHRSRHEIRLVVTGPDRPKGRGKKPAASPVKRKALELGLPLAQPDSLKSGDLHTLLGALKADLLVVVAFRILPESLLSLARLGAVNLHASLLPKYRGAAPIPWAMAAGEKRTGATVFKLDRLVDHGGILAQRATDIGPDETAAELCERLMILGRDLLVNTLDALERGEISPREQEHASSTPAPKLRKEDGRLDWSRPAAELHNRVRAFNPYPVCFTLEPSGRTLRIWKARAIEGPSPGPGRLLASAAGNPLVGCGNGSLELLEVQPEGRARMGGAEYLRGLRAAENLSFH